MIQVKRIHAPPSPQDGCRILVDRLWPRGFTKQKAKAELWLKDVAPSDTLRKWFSHDPKRFKEFQKKYAAELAGKPELIYQIRLLEKDRGMVTLLFAAKDEENNNAVALKEFLSAQM